MTDITTKDAPKPRPVPEWHRHRYGDGATLKTGAGEIVVQQKLVSRGEPTTYYATVFGLRLKTEKPDGEAMKRYALATAKRWAALAISDIQSLEDSQAGPC